MKTLKEILPYYLGTGLKVTCYPDEPQERICEMIAIDTQDLNYGEPFYISAIELNEDKCRGNYKVNEIKPHFRTLDSLTKPITVEGYNGWKPFVPMERLSKFKHYSLYQINLHAFLRLGKVKDYSLLPFELVQILIKWHFNVFNLPTDQFIEIKD